MTPSRRSAKTQTASKADAHSYLSKAKEFMRAGEDSFALGNYTAETGNSIHAAIAAADSIAAARLGIVWSGEHSQAAGHVEKAGTEGKHAAAQLR